MIVREVYIGSKGQCSKCDKKTKVSLSLWDDGRLGLSKTSQITLKICNGKKPNQRMFNKMCGQKTNSKTKF